MPARINRQGKTIPADHPDHDKACIEDVQEMVQMLTVAVVDLQNRLSRQERREPPVAG